MLSISADHVRLRCVGRDGTRDHYQISVDSLSVEITPKLRKLSMSANKTTKLQPIPFLGFDGTCAEAMRFYEKVLGGTIKVMMTGAQSPIADQIPKEFADRILNAQLELPGGALLFAGDAPSHVQYEGIKGVSIALNFDTVEEAEAIFNSLAQGGRITMPFSPTFWAAKFGMLVDKYGVAWIINGELRPL
jgi:PhnB protein